MHEVDSHSICYHVLSASLTASGELIIILTLASASLNSELQV